MNTKFTIATRISAGVFIFVLVFLNKVLYPSFGDSWGGFVLEIFLLVVTCMFASIDAYLRSEKQAELLNENNNERKIKKNRLLKKIVLFIICICFIVGFTPSRVDVVLMHKGIGRISSLWVYLQLPLLAMMVVFITYFYKLSHEFDKQENEKVE